MVHLLHTDTISVHSTHQKNIVMDLKESDGDGDIGFDLDGDGEENELF